MFCVVIRFAPGAQILKDSNRAIAEIGEFLFKNSFTLRPPRLSGAISESYFTGKPEDPFSYFEV
jgi:hypothetical protein